VTSIESKAKKAKVLDLLEGYSSLIGKDLSGLTRALCRVAEPYPLDVVIDATERLADTSRFPPTPAELAEACATFNDLLHPKVVQLYTGIIEMDFGHGRIDMRGLTRAEQDRIIDSGGKIAGHNVALLSLEQKRSLIATGKLSGAAPQARLRKM